MVAVGHIGAGAGVDLDHGGLADVEGTDAGAGGQADPGGRRAAFAGEQLHLDVLRSAVALVGDGELATGGLGLLHADFQRGGLGREARAD